MNKCEAKTPTLIDIKKQLEDNIKIYKAAEVLADDNRANYIRETLKDWRKLLRMINSCVQKHQIKRGKQK